MSSSMRGAVRHFIVVACVLLSVSLLLPQATVAQSAGSATTTDYLNLRSGPSTDSAVITVMPVGASVSVNGSAEAGFYPVSYGGNSGYAHGDYLAFGGGSTSGGATGTAYVIDGALNLRSGPSLDNTVLTVMPDGAAVSLTEESANGFLGVTYNGTSGYAYGDYLSTSGGSAAPAPSAPPVATDGATGTAWVTTGLNFRTGPSLNDAVIAVMPTGAQVTLTGQYANGFLGLSYNGTNGFAHSDYITTSGGGEASETPPSGVNTGGATGTVYVVGGALNLRTGPSLNDTVIAVMPDAAELSLTGEYANGFLGVVYNGTPGFAYGDYLADAAPASAPAPAPVSGGSGLIWPVSGGQWSIIQGYNGGTHQNRSGTAQYYYALDFARTDGNTAGQAVYAPASGTILWRHDGSGGLAIDMGNGYIVAMFHITYDGGLGRGQWVEQGQYLGTISGPGGAGYASTPHVDMTLWQSTDGGGSRAATPFSGGNAVSGYDFPDVGGWNQHNGTTFNP